MKLITTLLLTLGLVFTAQAQDEEAKAPTLETLKQKGSYGMGYELGSQVTSQGVSFDNALYMKGIQDGLSGSDPILDKAEMRKAMMEYQKELQKAMMSKREETSKKNKEEGSEFLQKHASEEGVQVTENGLQYQVLKEGTGDTKPSDTDTVTVHYTGRLMDGSVFDSSVERGEPATFPLQRVIPGWTQALKLMTTGAKWRVLIPSELGYGERGSPPRIPPNAVLDFEIELLDIKETSATSLAPRLK